MMTRSITRLREHWKFTRTAAVDALLPSCDDASWASVEVPHDWAIAGPFDRENDIDRKVVKGQADLEEGVQEVTGRTGSLPPLRRGWRKGRRSGCSVLASSVWVLIFSV